MCKKKYLKFEDYNNCLKNDNIILKSQQRFKNEANNVFTEEVNKIKLSSNDDKTLQNFDKITSYPYDASAGKVYKTELMNAILQNFKYKMIKFDDVTNENKTEHNPNWPYIPDHPYRILIRGSGSGKKHTA